MNEEVKKYLQEIVENNKDNFKVVPEYGFTAEDYIKQVKEVEGKDISRRTARDRLQNLADAGEIVIVRPRVNFAYYVPKSLAHNAKIDEKAILDS